MATESLHTGPRAAQARRRAEAKGAPGDEALSGIPCPVLRASAAGVLDEWRRQSNGELEGEIVERLVALARAVHRARHRPEARVEVPPAASPCRRLLDRLRAEVIDHLRANGTAPTSESVLDVLAAFERVGRALEPDDDTDRLLRWPAGSEGLELLAEVAHDLRSPLTSILTLAEALRKGQSGEVSELQRRQLRLIYSAALGLSSVASDVIELAHGGDRLAEKEPAPFSVIEVFESVRDIVQPMAEEKELDVRVLTPAGDERMGFPFALSRVLLNLTTNALKFTETGFVEVAGRAKGLSRVGFSVRDSGGGIRPEGLNSLYAPFRKVRGREGYCFSGTGLGLTITRRLVEAMGSRLEVETRTGWGTRFHFELDLPPADRG